jgi:enterochelin esterase-like enzyme
MKAGTARGWTRRLVGALVVALLAACGGGGGGEPLPPPGSTQRSAIHSTETGLDYDLMLWLPPGYAQDTARYPVIYAMDCEYRFNTLSGVLESTGRRAILVNVCAMGAARRWVDFTMPGAAAYHRFLTRELIPFIDANLRTQPAHRTLSGHSLSGEFVLYALYLEDPANRQFDAFVSEECSCWYDAAMHYSAQLAEPIAMEQALYAADPALPVTLVMAGDTLANAPQVRTVHDQLAARHYTQLRLHRLQYSLGHTPMDGPAFTDALALLGF